jgi:hypothetical protein
MPILGSISVGVRTAERTPKIPISIAMTTKVYGLARAIRTIAIIPLVPNSGRKRLVFWRKEEREFYFPTAPAI